MIWHAHALPSLRLQATPVLLHSLSWCPAPGTMVLCPCASSSRLSPLPRPPGAQLPAAEKLPSVSLRWFSGIFL